MTVIDKIEEIVKEYCCNGDELCDNDCEQCEKTLADDLFELVEMVKNNP